VMSKDILYSRIFPHFMQSEILFLCRIWGSQSDE
jgi:hypothetical protein